MTDGDRDGLPDALEDQLLAKFVPTFLISGAECDGSPAAFVPGSAIPRVLEKDGTIYGQAFTSPLQTGGAVAVELHYYHLWSRDCGRMGHNLDAEHVSVLVKAEQPDTTFGAWKAVYWYAAAHEDTACDVSHSASAKALGAEHQGPHVWISAGKHASFLSEEQCRESCGADQCDAAFTLVPGRVINIGELGSPLNGAAWATSKLWLLARKMQPDFTSVLVARLEGGTGVVSANESRASVRAVIAAGASSFRAIDTSNRHAGGAFSTATDAADRGLRRAAISAGSALKRVRPRIPSWLSGR